MGPRAIPEAKHLINRLDDEKSRQVAEQVLRLGTAAEIEVFMQQALDEIQKMNI